MEPAEDEQYTLVKAKSEVADALIENNRIRLDRSRKWYIRQFVSNDERVGIQRFTGLPLNAWRAMWRRTIPVKDIEIYGMSNNMMKVRYGGLEFNAYLKWKALQEDIKRSKTLMRQGRTEWTLSEVVVPWLEKNCSKGFIPFSDYDLMFPDPTDEVTYMIDMAELS